ncbi:cytoplasmic tRNA 2-thiolation protein 2 [Echeneis naucrates]|uniref:Cytoplasmic tRNA 2-thiolation protein 2 n=1 Tax=Echeneis naucrates TaxID=173247 RepID=A0A665UU98_ECHNA|nr:cytoplasmic tRNA 2-thiolation protein 2 [Echeneis naucrates]
MCQVDEHYEEGLERAEVPSVSRKCVKCKEAEATVVIRAGDSFCRTCFREYFIHKFRAMLGKNRIIFPGEKVLLAVSGGPSSSSMLRQVQEGLSQNAHKKLRFCPGIIFIDEGGVVGQSVEQRRRTAGELLTVFRAAGFPVHMVPLEQVLDLPSSILASASLASKRTASSYKVAVDRFVRTDGGSSLTPQDQEVMLLPPVNQSQTQALQQLMMSATTLTARQELLNTLRLHLLVHTARSKGYNKVMLGDNGTRAAVKLVSSIALGRGAQLAQDTGFSDSRFGDIILVRPMRDYSAKEISYYNYLFSVPSVFIPALDTKTVDKSSIQHLTEIFITKLQADFPSTVSTVYRTSEKLQTVCRGPSTPEHTTRCLLCVCDLDTATEEASAFQATLTSEQLSVGPSGAARTETQRQDPVGLNQAAPPRQCCPSGGGAEDCGRAASGGGCCSSARLLVGSDLRSLLCYSCQLMVKDLASVESLPHYILSEAQRRQRRSQMRDEISDFLLGDDEG